MESHYSVERHKGAYIVSHDRDDLHAPLGIAFDDEDSGDYSATMAQQLTENQQVDMSSAELNQLAVSRRRIKRVHRILVLCSSTIHDAVGLKRIYPSAKIDT